MNGTETLDPTLAGSGWSTTDLTRVLDELQGCEAAVSACATAMLIAGDPHLADAVARDMDCTDVVMATRRVLTRTAGTDRALVEAQIRACVVACERSTESCGRHAGHHEHCRVCAEATRRCADACRSLLTES